MCLPVPTIPPPNEDCRKAVSYLKYVAIGEGIAIFLALFILEDFFALFNLILIFILYQAWSLLNHCSCVFYIIYSLWQAFYLFIGFGVDIEYNLLETFGYSSGSLDLTIEIILFIFYTGSTYFAYVAYKAFKQLAYYMQAEGGGQFDQEQPLVPQQRPQPQEQNQNRNQWGGQPTSAWGQADAIQPQQQSQQQQPQQSQQHPYYGYSTQASQPQQQQQQPTQSQKQQYFQGQGRVIG